MDRLWLSTLLIAASPHTILPLLPPVAAVAAFSAALWVHCLVLADAVDPPAPGRGRAGGVRLLGVGRAGPVR